jgi:hypothetical protein
VDFAGFLTGFGKTGIFAGFLTEKRGCFCRVLGFWGFLTGFWPGFGFLGIFGGFSPRGLPTSPGAVRVKNPRGVKRGVFDPFLGWRN